MSTLQYELLQSTNGLSDESLQIVLEYVRNFIASYDSKMTGNDNEKPCRIGSRKGFKFVADGHDIDDYNDEIEEMFGVND